MEPIKKKVILVPKTWCEKCVVLAVFGGSFWATYLCLFTFPE